MTVDQFRDALRDAGTRAEIGVSMTDLEAREVLSDEARVAEYYAIWEQNRGRRPANARHWQPTAVAGFVLSLVGILAGGYCFLPFAWTGTPLWVAVGIVAAVVLSANGLSATSANGTRGRGLAISGIVLGCLSVLGGIATIVFFVSS